MFQDVTAQLEAIKKDIQDLKAGRPNTTLTRMDDLESLFSSLDSDDHQPTPDPPFAHLTPLNNFVQLPGPLSPPSVPGSFRPRANSVPPIYLEPTLTSTQAQQMRTSAPQRYPQSTPGPLPGSGASSSSASFHLQLSPPVHMPGPASQALMSPPPPQPTLPLAPLPIPQYMPLKRPEAVIAQNIHYLKKDTIGRVATKLARYSYFGEDILARSSVGGAVDRHPLDSQKLGEMKSLLKSKFPQESPTEFESTWARCIESLYRMCNYFRSK